MRTTKAEADEARVLKTIDRKLREHVLALALTVEQQHDLEVADLRGVIVGHLQHVARLEQTFDAVLAQRDKAWEDLRELRAWKVQVEHALIEFYSAVDQRDYDKMARHADHLRGWEATRERSE